MRAVAVRLRIDRPARLWLLAQRAVDLARRGAPQQVRATDKAGLERLLKGHFGPGWAQGRSKRGAG